MEIDSRFLGYHFAEKYSIVLTKVCRIKCALSKLNNSLGVLLDGSISTTFVSLR